MLPDFERADRIGESWSYPESRTFAELLIDCEEDRVLRAVLVSMLREADDEGKLATPARTGRVRSPPLPGSLTKATLPRVAPETQYAKTPDGVYIAYQVTGEGPVDVAWQFDWLGNVDLVWETLGFAQLFRGIASFARLIIHDRRATGLSSSNVPPPNLETRAADLRVVLDAVWVGATRTGGHP
jgi:hypothetical protein